MTNLKKEKLTLSFSTYESEQLNSIQFSFLFGVSKISGLPPLNEILRGAVLFAFYRTVHRGVLKGFSNGLLRRRNIKPPPEEEDEQYKEEQDRITERNAPVKVDPDEGDASRMFKEDEERIRLAETKSGNYSFYFNEEDIERVNELRNRVSSYSSIPINEISKTEIVREAIHFIIDNKIRNLGFRYLTYAGNLYGLEPAVSVTLGELRRGRLYFDILQKTLISLCDYKKIQTIRELNIDRKECKKFVDGFLKEPTVTSPEVVPDLTYAFLSKVNKMDFYYAFVGAEMLYYTGRYNIVEIPRTVLYMLVVGKRVGHLRIGVDLFKYYLDVLYDASEMLVENGL